MEYLHQLTKISSQFLKYENRERIMDCLNDNVSQTRKEDFRYILSELTYIYAVIASHEPRKFFCLNEFEERGKALMIFMTQSYSWINLGTYLHIGFRAGQEYHPLH